MNIATFGASSSETASAIAAVRPGIVGAALLTVVLNLLPLAAAIYVLLLFDTVLASHSGATLIGIFALVAAILAARAFLAAVRERLLGRSGDALALHLHRRLDSAAVRTIETTRSPGDGLQASRDLDAIRHFLGGRGAAAFADVPAVLFFVLVLVLFHGWLSLTLLVAAAVMLALLASALHRGAQPARDRAVAIAERNAAIEVGYRHAELIRVLGMHARAAAARAAGDRRLIAVEGRLGDAVAGRSAVAHGVRLVAGAAMLAVGGWLAITGRASVGTIAAAALLADCALKPIEDAIANSREFALARLGWQRIGILLASVPAETPPLPLPAPSQSLAIEALSLVVPDSRRVVLRDVSFELAAGDVLVVLGASGEGKSALLRALAGAWRPAAGKVRLDGGALDQWDPAALGRHVGYLPQVVELFDGTVAQNIARFDPAADPDAVIAAAVAAGVHDMIVRLPAGYDTEVGAAGDRLSAGERQRIGFARALYGDPFLIALDEPSAYADGVAQAALGEAVRAASGRGAIVVSVGNAPAIVEAANRLLVLRHGRVQDFGPKDEVRTRLLESRGSRRVQPITAGAVAAQE